MSEPVASRLDGQQVPAVPRAITDARVDRRVNAVARVSDLASPDPAAGQSRSGFLDACLSMASSPEPMMNPAAQPSIRQARNSAFQSPGPCSSAIR
jgi:hypothetical protein